MPLAVLLSCQRVRAFTREKWQELYSDASRHALFSVGPVGLCFHLHWFPLYEQLTNEWRHLSAKTTKYVSAYQTNDIKVIHLNPRVSQWEGPLFTGYGALSIELKDAGELEAFQNDDVPPWALPWDFVFFWTWTCHECNLSACKSTQVIFACLQVGDVRILMLMSWLCFEEVQFKKERKKERKPQGCKYQWSFWNIFEKCNKKHIISPVLLHLQINHWKLQESREETLHEGPWVLISEFWIV